MTSTNSDSDLAHDAIRYLLWGGENLGHWERWSRSSMTMKNDKGCRSEIADAIHEMISGAREAGVVPRTTITGKWDLEPSHDDETAPVTQISPITKSGSDFGK